jgi:aldose 1-epimerase
VSGRARLCAGALSLELEPAVGGAITAFRAGGQDLMRPGPDGAFADVLQASSFPLVPYCNRIRDGVFTFRGREIRIAPNLPPQKHPLHGTGWRAAWTVTRADASSAEVTYDHAAGAWPWTFRAVQTFALDEGGLDWRLVCENTDREPMPCGLGVHPYFPSNAETVLDLNTTGVWTVDEEVMPVALEPSTGRYDLRERRIDGADLDNGYEGWDGRAEVLWPDRGLALRILSPGATRFQVYSPREGGLFCAEPATHANAALNRPEGERAEHGLRVLAPGESMRLDVRFEIG